MSHTLQKEDCSIKIYLIDPKERFVFLPLLFELASGTASTVEVAPFYKDLLSGSKIDFIQGRVEEIDFQHRLCTISPLQQQHGNLTSDTGKNHKVGLYYDYLVLATGNEPRLDLIPGAKEHSLPFYSVNDANKLNNKLQTLKRSKRGFVRVTVLGGGYSGVELATNVVQELGQDRSLVTIVDRNNRIMATSSDFNRNAAE
eukprot:gene8162-9004_t